MDNIIIIITVIIVIIIIIIIIIIITIIVVVIITYLLLASFARSVRQVMDRVFSFLLWPKREARGPCKQGRKKRGKNEVYYMTLLIIPV